MRTQPQATKRFSGARMLAARTSAKMSRRDLARAIGDEVTERTIARYEMDDRYEPDVSLTIRIAQALGIGLEDLLQ